jgi:hypothetical protein
MVRHDTNLRYPDWGKTVTRRKIEEYVRGHFTDPWGYRLSCDQDVLLLRRRADAPNPNSSKLK